MRSLRSRYFLPMLMIPLFFVALFQAKLRYRTCSANGGVCFDYPIYLKYETLQALDLHWPVKLIPAAMLGQLPDIIYSGPRSSSKRLQYVILAFSVVIYWCLIGLWWERLLSGHRLAPERKTLRIFLLFLVAVLFTLVATSIYHGIRGGYEGPGISDAAVISPLLLTVMALTECNVLPRFLRGIRGQVAIPVMLLGLFIWTDTVVRDERLQHEIE